MYCTLTREEMVRIGSKRTTLKAKKMNCFGGADIVKVRPNIRVGHMDSIVMKSAKCYWRAFIAVKTAPRDCADCAWHTH